MAPKIPAYCNGPEKWFLMKGDVTFNLGGGGGIKITAYYKLPLTRVCFSYLDKSF